MPTPLHIGHCVEFPTFQQGDSIKGNKISSKSSGDLLPSLVQKVLTLFESRKFDNLIEALCNNDTNCNIKRCFCEKLTIRRSVRGDFSGFY